MPSRHLLDPELGPVIELIPGGGLTGEMLAAMRGVMVEQTRANAITAPPEVVMSERTIPGPGGSPDVRVLVFAPLEAGEDRPGILHIHGGGYVIGAPEMSIDTCASYATQLGAVVVSVDYRLAPETPFPGPVEDCYAGLKWLHAHAAELGVEPARIAISGESAGGGLAAATTLMARDRGEVPVAFQHLIVPMLDDRTASGVTPSVYAGQYVWTPSANIYGWSSMLGCAPGGDDVSPYCSPARAEDLSGLPPTFISCGALDLFIDEDLDYAKRLIGAGVPTELHIYPGAPHAFMFVTEAAVTKQHARDSMDSLRRGLKRD